MAKMNVKKGDNVMVISGKDKGKAGKVLSVETDSSRVYVEGVNMVKKSVKPKRAQDKGGIISQEGKIDSSNVMIICPNCDKVVRINHAVVNEDGKETKIRVCNKCGSSLEVKKSSAKRAAKKVAKKATKKVEEAPAKDEN